MDSNGQILFFPEKEYQGTVEEVKQEMIDYVHNKYPDLEFQVLSFEPRQFAHSNYEIMWVLPREALPKEYFSVKRHDSNDIQDDYIYFVMTKQIQASMQQMFEEYFPGSKFVFDFFRTGIYPPQDFMPDMNLANFIQWGFDSKSCQIICQVYVCANSYEELNQDSIKRIESKLVELAPHGTLAFIGVSDDDLQNIERYVETDTFTPTKELFSKRLCWSENERWEGP